MESTQKVESWKWHIVTDGYLIAVVPTMALEENVKCGFLATDEPFEDWYAANERADILAKTQ